MTDGTPDAVRAVLTAIKRHGASTASEVGARLGVTREAARQHLAKLELEGLVRAVVERSASPAGGRPSRRFVLTTAGEHRFEKRYPDLVLALLDTLAPDAVRHALAAVVDRKVRAWRPKLAGLSIDARLEALRDLYVEADPWIDVEHDDRGPLLVERNCPYLDVALAQPALCAVTVSTLSRLLGRRVVRERTFQAGHGRCVFRVTEEPFDPDGGLATDP